MVRKKVASKSAGKSSTRKAGKTAARRTTARASTGIRRARRGAAGNSPHAPAIQGWPTDPMGGVPPLQLAVPNSRGAASHAYRRSGTGAPARSIHWGRTGSATGPRVRHFVDLQPSGQRQVQGAGIGISEPRSRLAGRRCGSQCVLRANDFPPEDVKQGLSFFHDVVRDATNGRQVTVFSGESPDVVAHELGHAVLDSLKPALFELASIEAAAFHESFGDMSAILTALQLPSVRQTSSRKLTAACGAIPRCREWPSNLALRFASGTLPRSIAIVFATRRTRSCTLIR